ncbi:hypothetical protein Mapa_011173 [Marchantia paleacea]|nr:hypothetical protein Mapa_011173 [Marchantia paleacea]
MSTDREGRHAYSAALCAVTLGSDAPDTNNVQTTKELLSSCNEYGGRTEKDSSYLESAGVMTLTAYTIVKYDSNDVAQSREKYDANGTLLPS